jgi:hypothetical protein
MKKEFPVWYAGIYGPISSTGYNLIPCLFTDVCFKLGCSLEAVPHPDAREVSYLRSRALHLITMVRSTWRLIFVQKVENQLRDTLVCYEVQSK